jgi:group II intron reverse transcriptase/maturase
MTNHRAEEYYDYYKIKEELYTRASQGERFHDILSLIVEENNLRMSYRKIKGNKGSRTKGSDEYTIEDVKCTSLNQYLKWMNRWFRNYCPKPVRRKYIPKPNGDKRPLGIPCIRDRLLQQAILQILEPMLEAKMSQHSFGFRQGRSVQDAIEYARNLVRLGNYFAVDFDIRKCFDTIPFNHLIDILWKNGICDKRLLMIIKKMLKAPVQEDGKLTRPEKGTPQGGIVSPVLMNIYLNELDQWVSSQYENNPSLGKREHSRWFTRFRKTKLKKGILVRYADDFAVFTDNAQDAKAWYYATKAWLKNNLKLEINEGKSRIVDLRKHHLTFLGYKIKGNKYGVSAHEKDAKSLNHKHFRYTSSSLADKLLTKMVTTIKLLLRLICIESNPKKQMQLVYRLNFTVLGYHNYAKYATECASDLWKIYQRLKSPWYKTKYLKGDATTTFTDTFLMLYPECQGLTPIFSIQRITIFPIWKVRYQQHSFQFKDYLKQHGESSITAEIHKLLQHPVPLSTMEYNDLRISKYAAQKGYDYVTGYFLPAYDVHCHHIIPKSSGGKDSFDNLVVVSEATHKLIHSTCPQIPIHYTSKMIAKLNKLRDNVGNNRILF